MLNRKARRIADLERKLFWSQIGYSALKTSTRNIGYLPSVPNWLPAAIESCIKWSDVLVYGKDDEVI